MLCCKWLYFKARVLTRKSRGATHVQPPKSRGAIAPFEHPFPTPLFYSIIAVTVSPPIMLSLCEQVVCNIIFCSTEFVVPCRCHGHARPVPSDNYEPLYTPSHSANITVRYAAADWCECNDSHTKVPCFS